MYSQFALAVIQKKNEQQIPDERAHEGRIIGTAELIEANDVEDLEGVGGVEGGLAISANEEVDHPRAILHVLHKQGGVEDELQ